MQYHTLSIEDTIKKLDTSQTHGLSWKEVQKRSQEYGPNMLESKKKKSYILCFFEQFKDFMIIILLLAALVSFSLSYIKGETDFVDPIIILSIVILNALLGVMQEAKAERALEALKRLAAPNAFVIRDGCQCTVPSKELVPGDIILLEAGQFIPADARLIKAVQLNVDEASLTGESHPVEKNASLILREETPLGDRKNMVSSGLIVTAGRGVAVVTAIGMQTEVGRIAKMIVEDETPDTPLQKRLAKTGKILGLVALLICGAIFILGIIQGRPPFDMFMTSVSLAVAAIPEGLPAIVTIMLSLGVQRMAKKNSVVRKLPAVETLGSATYICSDKTGTLTQNKMTVTACYSGDSALLLECALLCTDSGSDPTEKAIIDAAENIGLSKKNANQHYKRVHELPFDSERKLMTTVHQCFSKPRSKGDRPGFSPGSLVIAGDTLLGITKGAFDVMLNRCTHIWQNGTRTAISRSHKDLLQKQNAEMTKQALRVIAVAVKSIKKLPLPNPSYETGLTFIGLIGMIDPPRPQVREAVRLCNQAGITPVMITGDHISTACAIAEQVGILPAGDKSRAITGEEINKIPAEKFEERIKHYRVYARVSPEHKVRIVKTLQKKGEVVAMTGDGVNDAPALKSADIGCAMGMSGTDVAKNAADMILLDDNFATIVSAVREGRGIYSNIRKAVHFLLSCNIGEILTIFAAILFGMPSPLQAVQLLWVNLVTDSLPAIALGMERASSDIMKKPPISPEKGMFTDGLAWKILFEGLMIGALALIAYLSGGGTMAFAVLGLSQLFHAFNMRSEHSIAHIGLFSNPKMVLAFLVGAALQIGVISVPALAATFRVTPLSSMQWLLVAVLSFLPIPIVELQKLWTKNKK